MTNFYKNVEKVEKMIAFLDETVELGNVEVTKINEEITRLADNKYKINDKINLITRIKKAI